MTSGRVSEHTTVGADRYERHDGGEERPAFRVPPACQGCPMEEKSD
jgi:hypothetical protein